MNNVCTVMHSLYFLFLLNKGGGDVNLRIIDKMIELFCGETISATNHHR